jgi:hypothetical protein
MPVIELHGDKSVVVIDAQQPVPDRVDAIRFQGQLFTRCQNYVDAPAIPDHWRVATVIDAEELLANA